MIYIESKSNDPRYNTALELYAFNELAEKDDVFMLWINSPCIVVGKNQNTTEEVNQKFCDDKDIKIVRRVSGGGAVYHDLNNLTQMAEVVNNLTLNHSHNQYLLH